jgi:hypothetical protein
MAIRTTITTDSVSMKLLECRRPGMIDCPKKLSNQQIVNTRMISANNEIFLSGVLPPPGPKLGRMEAL